MIQNDLREHGLRLMNRYWTDLVERLHREHCEHPEISEVIDAAGVVDEAMLNVAIGQIAGSRGLRAAADLLRPIAANFDRLADQIDDAMIAAGGSGEKSQKRH